MTDQGQSPQRPQEPQPLRSAQPVQPLVQPSSQQPVQPVQPTPVQPPSHQKPHDMTVCGVVGVVFGALGLVLSFILIINNLAAILGFIGVILAIIGLVGTFRGRKRGKGVAIAAAVLSVLAIVITLAMQSAASKAIDDAFGGGTDTTQSSDSKGADSGKDTSDKTSDDGTDGNAQTSGAQDLEGDLSDVHVKIVSAQRSGNDMDGAATVLVTYEWTNNTDGNSSFAALTNPQVFQNGKELDTAIYMDSPEGYDAGSYLTELQPGATGTVTLGYTLSDDSPVTVEVSDLFSLDDTAKVTHTFEL